MFSIADIDTSSEQQALDAEDEEGSEGETDDGETSPSYPIRTSITITKVIACLFGDRSYVDFLCVHSLMVPLEH